MAYIKIDLNGILMDGHNVTFKAPCDCTAIDGLKVCYIENSELKEKIFTMKDTHGNTLTGLGNLFKEGAYVHAILDTGNMFAYLQNADTNGYVEAQLKGLNSKNVKVEVDNGWHVFKFPDGTYFAAYSWGTGSEPIQISSAYGNIYISTTFYLTLPQNVTSAVIGGSSAGLGGGVGGVSLGDTRGIPSDLSDIPFWIWSATNITKPVKATFFCFGTYDLEN